MSARQGLRSLGFSRQEQWGGLPFLSPMHKSEKWKWSRSVISEPQRPHGLQPSRLLCSWDFTGKSTGVGCHCLLRNEDPVLSKLKEKNKFSQRNQWGLRGSRTWKRMKPVWVWYHARHAEGSYSLFSQGTWDISCASYVPQPKARELGFHSPTSASLSSFNLHPAGVSKPLY